MIVFERGGGGGGGVCKENCLVILECCESILILVFPQGSRPLNNGYDCACAIFHVFQALFARALSVCVYILAYLPLL